MSTESEHRPTLEAQDPPELDRQEQFDSPDLPDSPDSTDPEVDDLEVRPDDRDGVGDGIGDEVAAEPTDDDAVLLPREVEPEPMRDDVPADDQAADVQDPTPPDVAPDVTMGGTSDATGTGDQWRELQGRFVDDPAAAVQEAADLVEAAITSLRESLPGRDSGDTEQLRQTFQRYRAVHQALTTA